MSAGDMVRTAASQARVLAKQHHNQALSLHRSAEERGPYKSPPFQGAPQPLPGQ